MIVLSGAEIVLPDHVISSGSLLIDGDRIAAIEPRRIDGPAGSTRIDLHGALIVPGFIDVHVHGVEGVDVLDGTGALAKVARRLPRYGVTSFCPTSVACAPRALEMLLEDVRLVRSSPPGDAARVLPAHLESNFINPAYKGAQPAVCLRQPPRSNRSGSSVLSEGGAGSKARAHESKSDHDFDGETILACIDARSEEVGIVTIAPELEGGLELVTRLRGGGHIVSIGHSGATYEQALEAIQAGVSHATHLFNRMAPLGHRAPGAAAAILQSSDVAAEIICDGFHVHPALVALAIDAKGPDRVMAISDGTAGSGLPVGSRTRLGGQTIIVTERTAELEDGTLAGSVLTMDRAFAMLVQQAGVSVLHAARMCATSPAEQLRLSDTGRIMVGGCADLVVLDRDLRVQSTWLAGRQFRNTVESRNV